MYDPRRNPYEDIDAGFLYWLHRKANGEFDDTKQSLWHREIFPILFVIVLLILI